MRSTRDGCAKAYTIHRLRRPSLLTLPPEIRSQIYQYVLGNNLIHVDYDYDFRRTDDASDDSENDTTDDGPRKLEGGKLLLRYGICRAGLSNLDAHATFSGNLGAAVPKAVNKSNKSIPGLVDPLHDSCIRKLHRRHSRPPALDLRVLQVCKSIYAEASLIPCASNTFIFKQPFGFEKFVISLGQSQLGALRSIHLLVTLEQLMDAVDWDGVISDVTGRLGPDFTLNSLRNLHITILRRFCVAKNYRSFRKDGFPEFWISCFSKLRRCPLKKVTVSMMDHEIPESDYLRDSYDDAIDSYNFILGKALKEEILLNREEDLEFAGRLKKRLLTPAPSKADDHLALMDPKAKAALDEEYSWVFYGPPWSNARF